MARAVVLAAVLASSNPAWADELEPWTREEPVRVAVGAGSSGTLDPRQDFAMTLGVDAHVARRVEKWVSFGLHAHLSIRNWAVISDFYTDLELKSADAIYGYAFGWLSGTSMLGLGPELVFSADRSTRPWGSFGTSVVLFIDPRDPVDRVAWAHAAQAAIGYDFGGAGLSLRVHWAPEGRALFGTTGDSGLLNVMASIDFLRTRPRRQP